MKRYLYLKKIDLLIKKMDTTSMIEAKKEYTSQLQQILSPRIYERFKFIFDGTIEIIKKELSMNHIQNESVVKIFQKQLVSIKDWNESSIIEEYERIKHRSKCNYLDKLIKAVIIANMKILSTIQYGAKRKSKIQVHIPTPTHFIHKCYIECAKEIYKNPYIFDMSISLSSKEKHQNLRDSLILIDNGIHSAIRQLLPISDLLEQNFNSDAEDESEDEEESVASKADSESTQEEDESTVSGGSRSRSDSESSQESTVSSASKVSSLSSNSIDSESESEMDSGNAEDAEDEASVISGSSTTSSSLSSQSLGSKVGSVLNNQSIQDIDIRIGGDNETQTMLAGAVAERADSHNDAFENSDISPISQATTVETVKQHSVVEQTQQSGGNGGFLGALYNTFASSKNIKPDASDAPAPIRVNSSVQHVTNGGTEEFKQIVYSGNAVPKGYALSSPPAPVTHVTPKPVPVASGSEKPLFDMRNSIYPPKVSSSQSIKSGKSQGKIIKTIHRPLGGFKNGLSLREMKYGKESTIKENDNISVRSTGSNKSIKSINSDEFAF